MENSKASIINKLQKDILAWQGFIPPAVGKVKGIGLGPIEEAFPNSVFPVGTIHEMICATPEQAAATGGMMSGIMAVLMQQGGVCIWISTSRKIFPPSLMAFNAEPDRVIFIDVLREKDVLWAMEESLKCEGLAAVIAEVKEITFAQSRRLQLAVENSKVTGFILRNDPRKLSTNTCVARWEVNSIPSELEDGLPGVGFPRWRVDLLRVRNGNPGSWDIEWADGSFVPVEERVTSEQLHERKAG